MPAVSRTGRSSGRTSVEGNFLESLKRENLPASLRCHSTPPPASSADSQPGSFNDDDEGPYNQDGALLTSAEREVLEALLPQKMERKRRSPGLRLTAVERGVNPSDETQMRNLGRERNKHSAQISRKRKELYQKALEGRVMRFGKMCIEATARAAAADAINAQNAALQVRCAALSERLSSAVELLEQVESAAARDTTVGGALAIEVPHFHASFLSLSCREGGGVGADATTLSSINSTTFGVGSGGASRSARTLPASLLPPELEECAQRLGFVVGPSLTPAPDAGEGCQVGGSQVTSGLPPHDVSDGAVGQVVKEDVGGLSTLPKAEAEWDTGAQKRERGASGCDVDPHREVLDSDARQKVHDDVTMGGTGDATTLSFADASAISKRGAGVGGGLGGLGGGAVTERHYGRGSIECGGVSVEAAAAAVGVRDNSIPAVEGGSVGAVSAFDAEHAAHTPTTLLFRKSVDAAEVAEGAVSAFRPSASLQLPSETFQSASLSASSPPRFGTCASLSLPVQPPCACVHSPPHPASASTPTGFSAEAQRTSAAVAWACSERANSGNEQRHHGGLQARRGSAEVVAGFGGVPDALGFDFGCGGGPGEREVCEYEGARLDGTDELYVCGRDGDGEGSVIGVEIVSADDHAQGLPLLSGGRGDGEEEVGGAVGSSFCGSVRPHGSFTSRAGRCSFGAGGYGALRGWGGGGGATGGPMSSPVGGMAVALLDDNVREGGPVAADRDVAVCSEDGGDGQAAEEEGSAAETSPATTLMCSDCGSGVCMCAHLHSSLSSREGRSPPHEASEAEGDVDMVAEGAADRRKRDEVGEGASGAPGGAVRAPRATRRRVGSFTLGAPAIEARLFEQYPVPASPSTVQQQQLLLHQGEDGPPTHPLSHHHDHLDSPSYLCGLLPNAAPSPHATSTYPSNLPCVSPGTVAAPLEASTAAPLEAATLAPPTVPHAEALPLPCWGTEAVRHPIPGGSPADDTAANACRGPAGVAQPLSAQCASLAASSVGCSRSPSTSCARTPASACVRGGSLYSTSGDGSSGASCASGYFDAGGIGGAAAWGADRSVTRVTRMGESDSPLPAMNVEASGTVVSKEHAAHRKRPCVDTVAVADAVWQSTSSCVDGGSRSASSCAHDASSRSGAGRAGGRASATSGRKTRRGGDGGTSSDASGTPPPPVSSCGPRNGRARRTRRVLPTGGVSVETSLRTPSRGAAGAGVEVGGGGGGPGRPLFAFFLFAAMTLCTSHAGWTADVLGGLGSSVPTLDSVFAGAGAEAAGARPSPAAPSKLSAVAGPCSTCPPPTPSPFARTLMSIKLPAFPRGVLEAAKGVVKGGAHLNRMSGGGGGVHGERAASGGAEGGLHFGPVGGFGGAVGVVGMGGGVFGRGRAEASARRGGRARVSDEDVEVDFAEDGVGGWWEVRSGGTSLGGAPEGVPLPPAGTAGEHAGVPAERKGDESVNVTVQPLGGGVSVGPTAAAGRKDSAMNTSSSPFATEGAGGAPSTSSSRREVAVGGQRGSLTKKTPAGDVIHTHSHTHRGGVHGARVKGRAGGSGVGGGVSIAHG